MKLVASSKLRSVEEQLQRGRAFGESILNAIAISAEDAAKIAADAAAGGAVPAKKDEDGAKGIFLDERKHLCVLVTTDRGLCGAVNSSLSRALRKELNVAIKEKRSLRLLTLGDKGRAQIARDYMPVVARAIDNCFDKDPIFPLAAALAAKIVAEPYEVLTLYYNHYENQAKFHNTYKQIPQLVGGAKGKSSGAGGKLAAYELEPEADETMLNLQEYGIASALFYAMLETAACETSQRVMAMDNATTNAKDMVHSLSLLFNRARQSKITTELTEIISGSESLNTGVVEY
jgi:F-type H+-transporting ATPase subunit gamma